MISASPGFLGPAMTAIMASMTPSSTPLGITGSTGHLGGRIARRLADRGVGQRLLVRDPSRAPELPDTTVARADF